MPKLDPITGFPLPVEPDNSGLDRMAAGMALSNPISGAIDAAFNKPPRKKESVGSFDYDPFSDPQTKGYDPSLFTQSTSKEETANIIADVEYNKGLYERSTGAAGAAGVAGSVVGILGNPFITLPALFTGGASIPTMIAAEAGGEMLSEMWLHSQQPLRTKTESALNIGIAAAAAGVGGALAYKYGAHSASREATGAAHGGDGMYTHPIPDEATLEVPPAVRAAAEPVAEAAAHAEREAMAAAGVTEREAAAEITTSEHPRDDHSVSPEVSGPETGAGEVVSAGPLGSALQRLAPAGDVLAKSESKTAKETIQNLVDVPYRFKSDAPVPQSVESKIHQAEGDWASMKHFFDEEYLRYKKRGGNLSPEEFDIEVARAMRSGDQHEIPEVAATASYFRKFDQGYFERAAKLGLYGDEAPVLKGSKSHLQRVYVRDAIIKGYDDLRKLIRSKVARSIARSEDNLIVRYFDDTIDESVTAYIHASDLSEMENLYPDLRVVTGKEIVESGGEAVGNAADEIARSVISRMLGGEPVDIAHLDYIVPKAGSLHERTLTMLSDAELEPYLNNNATEVMSITSRQMLRNIEMADTFGRTDLADQIKQITREYDQKIANAKSANERKALLKRRDKDIRTVQGLRDLILGTYGVPKDPASALVTTGRSLRILAMLSYGANITSSSLSDLVSPALRHGLEPFKHGLKVLFSGVTREQVKFANRIGLAVESLTSARAAAFTEMAFNTKRGHKALHAFGKWTGLNKFTDLTQALNVVGTSEMWVNWLRQLDTLSEKKMKKLLDVGIDKEWGQRIIGQIRKYGKQRNGVTLPETYLWEDIEAARRFENALRKEVLTTTLMPGKGDIPLFAKTEQGKFFTMFMSFMLSSTQRWIVAGMQRADIEFLQGMLMISVAGGLVNYAKKLATGQEISDDPIDNIIEGMDRGGALGIMALPVGWARDFVHDGKSSRYVGRGMVEQFMIPAGARYAQDISAIMLKIASNEELTEEDVWRMAKAVPLANSFHFIDLAKQMANN